MPFKSVRYKLLVQNHRRQPKERNNGNLKKIISPPYSKILEYQFLHTIGGISEKGKKHTLL